MLDLIESNFNDLCDRFRMEGWCWEQYIKDELLQKKELKDLINYRQSKEDLWDIFQQGLPGTVLNAFCLYALIRYFGIKKAIETGVANGFYTSFILSAIIENGGELESVELSNHEDIANCVPLQYRTYPKWKLTKGVNSLEYLKNKVPHDYDLCLHDSLHTKEHMSKEFEMFKNTNKEQFFVIFDDQNSENFWEYAFNVNMQSIDGYKFKLAEGRYCTIKGHLGGYIKYNKK